MPVSSLGQYFLEARHDERRLYGDLEVADFRPPNFQVELELPTTVAVAGDRLTAQAQSRYLFGAPAQAVQHAQEAARYAQALSGSFLLPQQLFYASLAHLALLSEQPPAADQETGDADEPNLPPHVAEHRRLVDTGQYDGAHDDADQVDVGRSRVETPKNDCRRGCAQDEPEKGHLCDEERYDEPSPDAPQFGRCCRAQGIPGMQRHRHRRENRALHPENADRQQVGRDVRQLVNPQRSTERDPEPGGRLQPPIARPGRAPEEIAGQPA
ncbi:MAG: hypothetical protein HC926_05045, partial [Synechococcaceae cyanobacterium SM2_3_60]|nr:hypothetical protein [Synechococcaceae cyanobacterium SM2_3_60]